MTQKQGKFLNVYNDAQMFGCTATSTLAPQAKATWQGHLVQDLNAAFWDASGGYQEEVSTLEDFKTHLDKVTCNMV